MNAVPAQAAQVELLLAPTPERWFDVARERWHELLVDHANCEKKAASTALSLMFAYSEDIQLTERLSRLAREELRHFEQVQKLMQELRVPFLRLAPSRYAEGLRKVVHRAEPDRLIDLLLCGALIEARSCERFERLAAIAGADRQGLRRACGLRGPPPRFVRAPHAGTRWRNRLARTARAPGAGRGGAGHVTGPAIQVSLGAAGGDLSAEIPLRHLGPLQQGREVDHSGRSLRSIDLSLPNS